MDSAIAGYTDTHLRTPAKRKRYLIKKYCAFSLFMSCRRSYQCRFFIGIRLQSSLCQTPIRIEATPRDRSPKRALPLYRGPEKEAGASASTIYNEFALGRRLFNVARKKWKWIGKNPWADVEFSECRKSTTRGIDG